MISILIAESLQILSWIARFVGNNACTTRRDQSADGFEKLLTVLGEMTATSTNGAVNSFVDLKVATESVGIGCLKKKQKN